MKLRSVSKAFTCVLIFALAALLDYVTGYEVTSFPIYLVPIALTYFYFRKAGGYLAVGVASVIWLINDFSTGHHYDSEVVRYWNASARVLIYGLFVYGLSLYTKTVQTNRQRLDDLRAIIPMCHGCGKVLAVDGIWRPIDEAVAKMSEIPRECPACHGVIAKTHE